MIDPNIPTLLGNHDQMQSCGDMLQAARLGVRQARTAPATYIGVDMGKEPSRACGGIAIRFSPASVVRRANVGLLMALEP